MNQLNGRLDEHVVQIQASSDLLLAGAPGTAKYVSMKNFRKLQIVVDIANGTAVTGAAITLKQATTVAAAGEKALAFTRMLSNIDVAASPTMVETVVAANTFTTNATASKNLRYVMDVDSEQLDIANGFDCIRLDGTANAATGSRGFTVSYVLYGARYSGATAVTD